MKPVESDSFGEKSKARRRRVEFKLKGKNSWLQSEKISALTEATYLMEKEKKIARHRLIDRSASFISLFDNREDRASAYLEIASGPCDLR